MAKLNNRLTNTEIEKLKSKEDAYNSRSDGVSLFIYAHFPKWQKSLAIKIH